LLINYASGWIERLAGRRFSLGRHKERVKGEGLQEIVVINYPIQIIHSITAAESGAILDPEGYHFNKTWKIGAVYTDGGWARKGCPTGLVPDFVLTKAYLEVNYTAGYVLPKDVKRKTLPDWILPYDLQGIIWQIVSQELALLENGSEGLSAFSISDISWMFDKTPRQNWLDIISSYAEAV
jgi:hypothetical protein